MKKAVASRIMLTLILACFLTLDFNVPAAKSTPDLVNIYLESRENDGSTYNLGTMEFEPDYTFPGYSLPNMIWREIRPLPYQALFILPSNHMMDHWETIGGISVPDPYSGPLTNVYVSDPGTLIAVYKNVPPPTYDATINAHCNTEGSDVSVAITKDGTNSGYNTPHTFTGLTGTHTFAIPSTDSNGHSFKQWSTGSTSLSLPVSSGGTYTAYYEAVSLTLTVYSAHDSPVPGVGSHQYNNGDPVTCSVASSVEEEGILWTCTGWTGTGSVSPPSGSGTSASFTITQDSSITWNWMGSVPQRILTVYSAHDSPVPGVGSHQYNNGDPVTCSVASSVTEGSTVWICSGFTGTGSVPSSGAGNSVGPFPITTDSTITWNWQVDNPPSTPSKPQWVSSEQILILNGNGIFTSSATDQDSGDQVKITFDWGDGTSWISGFVASGIPVQKDHYWSKPGMFKVKTKATDTHGAESSWSESLETTVVYDEWVSNWAGYVLRLDGPTLTLSVHGRWTYPNYGSIPLFGDQGTWVGIGGVGWLTMLQVGIATRNPWGVFPFYEIVYPDTHDPPVYAFDHWNDVSAGDLIEAGITQMGPGRWVVYVKDLTRNWTWMPSEVAVQPDTTYVEWIHEPGASGSGIGDFGSINFQNAEVTVNAVTYKLGSTDPNLQGKLIVTDMQRGSATCTKVTPISNYDSFAILDTGKRPTAVSPATGVYFGSSANISVYDSEGNHDGYNPITGHVEIKIPDSAYFQDQDGSVWIVLYREDCYRIELVGTSDGDYHLHTQLVSNGTVTLDKWINSTITVNETKTYVLLHQISIQSVIPKTVIGEGSAGFVVVTVANFGNYTETFNVTAYSNATVIGTQLLTLTSTSSSDVAFTWDTSGFAKGNYNISAIADQVPGETYTLDNTLVYGWVLVTVPGDVNGDKTANVFDILAVKAHWGEIPSSPHWDPNVDANGDLAINVSDILTIKANWGQFW
jgi:hypothetical protein